MRKDDQLRIESAGNKLEPINIVDLGAKKLTIVFPHNSTFVHVDLIKTPAQAGAAGLPPNFATSPNISSTQSTRAGPSISPPPGFPPPPLMPSRPAAPFGGSLKGAGGVPAHPMPEMPGEFGAFELKQTDQTRTIQGMECTLYTLSARGQNFEIWATSDSALFPFHLLQRDFNRRRFGPPMLEEQWVELLQKKSLFPLEATLRMDSGGPERLSFKVEKIEERKLDDGGLFAVPKDFYEIQPPSS